MINNLPLRFIDDGTGMCEHLIPSNYRDGIDLDSQFRCATEEIVKLHLCAVYCNKDNACRRDLINLSYRLYKMTFSRVRTGWLNRLGDISEYWDWIKLYKVENDGRD